MKIELRIGKADLLHQEDAPCELLLANDGDRAISLPYPPAFGAMPYFRVLDAKSGVEYVRRSAPPERSEHISKEGEVLAVPFLLLDAVSFPGPGEYRVSAIYEYGDSERTESEPVLLKIRPTMPKNLFVSTLQRTVSYGVWMNLGSDPPDVVRTRFDVMPGGGVTETRALAKAGLRTKPILSVRPGGAPGKTHWIGWMEGGELHFLHAGDDVGAVHSIRLAASECEIVAPICADAALLWLNGPSRLQVARLAAERLGPSAELPPGRPLWMMSHAFSEKTRSATFVWPSAESVTLRFVPWSDDSIGAVTDLWAGKGRFLAAGATMDLDGAVLGALLIAGRERPELVEWELDAQARFQEKGRRELGWEKREPIGDASVRVSELGEVAVLLRNGVGEWFLHSRDKLVPLPPPATRSGLPLDVAFLNDVDPILICAEEGRGFRVLKMDGSSLKEAE